MVICFAEKQALNGSKPEPAIRSCDTGHRKPCFDSCHFTTTWPRKFPPRKYSISPSCRVDSKLPSHSPSACTDGRSYADVIIKIYRMDRLPHFLGYGATLRACVELRYYKRFILLFFFNFFFLNNFFHIPQSAPRTPRFPPNLSVASKCGHATKKHNLIGCQTWRVLPPNSWSLTAFKANCRAKGWVVYMFLCVPLISFIFLNFQ